MIEYFILSFVVGIVCVVFGLIATFVAIFGLGDVLGSVGRGWAGVYACTFLLPGCLVLGSSINNYLNGAEMTTPFCISEGYEESYMYNQEKVICISDSKDPKVFEGGEYSEFENERNRIDSENRLINKVKRETR